VTLTVAPVNDAPTLADQALTGDEDTPITGHLLATAADVDSPSLTAAIVTGPAHGALTLNADGSFLYAPNTDWYGTESFTYQVSDGELASNIATVSITLAPVNDAPVIAPRTLGLDEDTRVTFDPLAGASDIDGEMPTGTARTASTTKSATAPRRWTATSSSTCAR